MNTSGFNSWEAELGHVDNLMRRVSRENDPQKASHMYGEGVRRLFPADRSISLSRRELERPVCRVTRCSDWEEDINPWEQRDQLPVIESGLLSELAYANEPRVIQGITFDEDDPGAEYLRGMQTLITLPQYDDGIALNTVVILWDGPDKFDWKRLPGMLWQANLFGRSTLNLVLRRELQATNDLLDREMLAVGEIQRALLPKTMPDIDRMKIDAYYRTSDRAGGDYYDLFRLPNGRWGILIADVSGHGVPAAVIMAITHSIAHLSPDDRDDPAELLAFVNQNLSNRYTNHVEAFVTAFYAVFDPETRRLTFASAGHNPPRRWSCSTASTSSIDAPIGFPLGVIEDAEYESTSLDLMARDRLILYTDGIVEAADAEDELFGTERLDGLLDQICDERPDAIIRRIVSAVDRFTDGAHPTDDRTLLVAEVE